MCLLDAPVIDEGSHVPRPSVITRGNKRVIIGTSVYVHDGFDVIIDCNIVNGTPPITIQWFRNGSPDLSRGNVSTITVINATSNGDIFTCRAENIEGFDMESTVINVDYGTYICMYSKCVSCIFHICMCVVYDVHYAIQGNVQFCIAVDIHTMKFKDTIIHILDPPDIDEGSHVPRPSVLTKGNKTVKIGTPVYVYNGFDVTIDCNIVNGTPPITIQWFRNGSPDTTRGNVSTITITDASNGDVFKCRADNIIGPDTEYSTIHVMHGKCLCHNYLLTLSHQVHKCDIALDLKC